MAYIPGAMRDQKQHAGRYIPGALPTPPACECKPVQQPACQVQAPEEPQYLSPELQALVDEAKAKQAKESNPKNTESNTDLPLASEADWSWLRAERNKRLAATDGFQAGLTFEQRGQLFKYRQELRDLPMTVGTKWTRESVKWPTLPSGSGA